MTTHIRFHQHAFCRTLTLVMSGLLAAGVSACSSPGEQFVGRWTLPMGFHSTYLEISPLNADGTVTAVFWDSYDDESPDRIDLVLDEETHVLRFADGTAYLVRAGADLFWYATDDPGSPQQWIRARRGPFSTDTST